MRSCCHEVYLRHTPGPTDPIETRKTEEHPDPTGVHETPHIYWHLSAAYITIMNSGHGHNIRIKREIELPGIKIGDIVDVYRDLKRTGHNFRGIDADLRLLRNRLYHECVERVHPAVSVHISTFRIRGYAASSHCKRGQRICYRDSAIRVRVARDVVFCRYRCAECCESYQHAVDCVFCLHPIPPFLFQSLLL